MTQEENENTKYNFFFRGYEPLTRYLWRSLVVQQAGE